MKVELAVQSLTRRCRWYHSRNLGDAFVLIVLQLARAGRMTDDKRNEVLLLTDVLGSETLIDDIARVVEKHTATSTAILGPFWRENAPRKNMGDTIVSGLEDAPRVYLHGRIIDSDTARPIANAELDIWEAAPNGLYEQQDSDQVEMNLRGMFTTGEDGKYSLYCLRPGPYPVPDDGPAGDLLKLLDRHSMRAAHIHIMVKAPGYKTLVTELFDREDSYVSNDSMFAVKPSLIMDFVPCEDANALFTTEYTFKLASLKKSS